LSEDLTSIRLIKAFLPQLPNLLREEWLDGRISTEMDMSHCIYYHLRRRIPDRFTILSNVTLSGITISKQSVSGSFLMPDLIIIDNDRNESIRILFELKLDNHSSAFPEHIHAPIDADFRKLKKFAANPVLSKQLACGIFVYLYKCSKWSEREITAKIMEKLDDPKLKAITVNRYQDKNGKYVDDLECRDTDRMLRNRNRFKVGG
jgi:hypothetical protein